MEGSDEVNPRKIGLIRPLGGALTRKVTNGRKLLCKLVTCETDLAAHYSSTSSHPRLLIATKDLATLTMLRSNMNHSLFKFAAFDPIPPRHVSNGSDHAADPSSAH